MNSINAIELIDLYINKDERGDLIAIQFQKHLDLSIERSFLVFGKKDFKRGNHAHIKCNQFLCCISGSCEVKCDDGENSCSQILCDPSKILKIPNMIWSSQKYLSENTILIVFCDLDYCEKDYIRNYKTYLDLINNGS